ncbi:two-component system response regulator CreB [Rubritalea tangerina]|uniref:Two-component system response regulator CreB n=1 Tax=Rubritalea tangerina TaxID=430798 RepID=A0ABW4ZCZ5_9BACT
MPNAHILIVEDEQSIAENLIYALETENFTTTHLSVGAQVVDTLKTNAVDFVVLDVGLPDILGFEVCKQIRTFSNVPILFLTARDSEIDHVLGLELGADDYVTKPFSPRELAARIRAILRRSATPQKTTTNQSSLLQHDPEAMTITCLGNQLDLTAHEYKLLATFISHPGRTFTRDQLLEHAWEDPGSAMDRTVDAHIKSLRAKLRDASERCADVIQTRRGLGYCYHTPDEI